MSSENQIEFKNICKSFPGCKALSDISFSIKRGEIHAIVGENGAGKSTLLNILHGVFLPDTGDVMIDGEKVVFHDTHAAIQSGVAKVHQEINLIPDMSVAQNLMLGIEETKGIILDNKKMNSRARELLKMVRMEIDPDVKVRDLSTGELQLLQIAKAINIDAKIISFDEPTASLSKNETNILFELIDELKAKGITIIYVSHRMDEIFSITDRCTILRDGRYIDTVVTKDTTKDKLIHSMVGRDVGMFAKRNNQSCADMSNAVLEVSNLTKNGEFEDINFKLYKGEILGFYGLVGAKRTEVMRALFGADKYDKGTIILNGVKVKIKSPSDAIKKRIGLLPENRKSEGFIYEFSNAENIALTDLDKFRTAGFTSRAKKDENAINIGKIVNIKPADPGFKTANLSGGNQQKIVLAKWLSAEVDIMIFDEPTKGIDVGAKAEIYSLMEDLVSKGKSIIIVSSEQPEAIGMCDRLLVMHVGRIAKELDRKDFNEEVIVTYALEGKLNGAQ
ncbi:MAG: sugar ABC transporter ATP-binding protein [Oscillospiraceae bacterium]